MKKQVLNIAGVFIAILFSATLFSQTTGALTFSFTPVVHSPCYQATKSVMAVWIQTNAGAFVKTKIRYCCDTTQISNTYNHLPTWSVNAGGTATNGALGNTTDATTGATLPSFTAKTMVWDGKNVNGTSNGTTVADGVYKVTIQETWNHGTASTVTRSFTFTKGPNADHQTPANDANFTGIKLDWVPSATGINELNSENQEITLHPNPTNGIFSLDFKKASEIKIINTLGIVVHDEKVEQTGAGTRSIDLTNFANGIYLIKVLHGDSFSNVKVILNR